MNVETPTLDKLPARIKRLQELAYNMWWSWDAEARDLFGAVSPMLWRQGLNNSVQLLKETSSKRLGTLAENPDFLEFYDRIMARFDAYMNAKDTWFSQAYPELNGHQFAYFSAEFAVHTSVPIYSGGLGLLAGDTCKEASDLGLPFVGIGAFYPEGYFRQVIEADGSQEAIYERIDVESAALLPVREDDGTRLLVSIPVDSARVKVAVWRCQVGRIPVFLMDTDIPENDPWNRDLVARLYGGDSQVRLRQEIILGIGGVRVLRALGYDPTVIHLNEGHAAFAALELLREGKERGLSFEEAMREAGRRIVFTTHTPVRAGHDEFPHHMMEQHFRSTWEEMGISREEFLQLGTADGSHSFGMTVLALKTARAANGVSKKHGQVSREMWHFLFPDRELEDVPIKSITNGVHVPTWLSGQMVQLFDKYLGAGWKYNHDDLETWERVNNIPDEELWKTHLAIKTKLLRFMRRKGRRLWLDGGAPRQLVARGALLSAHALTVGFARRFATYKRATLILTDLERLKRILLDAQCPVQFIFAGKAHPADEPGKFLLRQVYEVCASHQFGGNVAFIENYDKQVAHHLVAGVDVWLNNPQPPKEASGTSGEKASLNGVPNLSVLDGWWSEGFNGKNGWGIDGDDDIATAEAIYSILETEIVPKYYRRDSRGVPREWVQVMKEAMRSTAAPFSARRMLKEYVRLLYLP